MIRKRLFAVASAAVLALTLSGMGVASAAPTVPPPLTPPGAPAKLGEVPVPPMRGPDDRPVPVANLNGKVVPPAPASGFVYAGQKRTETGITASKIGTTISKPSLDPDDPHTLWEMTIESADSQMVIELGWVVNRQNVIPNCDATCQLNPHVFGSAWWDSNGPSVAGGRVWCGSYVGGCGYVDNASNPINLGADILSARDLVKRFDIVFSQGAWWLYYDTAYLGYFPANLTHNQVFNSGGKSQFFGEIAYGHWPTCSDMGNAWLADNSEPYPQQGATMTGLWTAVNGGAYAVVDFTSNTTVTDNTRWSLVDMGTGANRYGGPGYSPNPGACPYNP